MVEMRWAATRKHLLELLGGSFCGLNWSKWSISALNRVEQVYQQLTQNHSMIIEMSNMHVFYNIMSNWDLIHNMKMRNLKLAHLIND
jgi:hypothetical protein